MHKIDISRLHTIRDGSGHSIFGPSGSSMWLNCPGSLIPNLLAKDRGNYDSAYGTVAHAIVEMWGKSGQCPEHMLGRLIAEDSDDEWFTIPVDEQMMAYAQQCIEWVEYLPGEKHWEVRVDISDYTPIENQGGTSDLIVVEGERMVVADWKFGKHKRVYAEQNTQGMLYALGALKKFDPEGRVREIEIRIAQPRLDNFDSFVISRDDLLVFGGWAKARMALAWSHSAPRVPGAVQCEYCKVRNDCAAAAKYQIDLTEGVFTDTTVTVEEMAEFKSSIDENLLIDSMQASTLDTEHLARLWPHIKGATKWWDSIKNELIKRAVDGEDLTQHGLKPVEGVTKRRFSSEKAASDHLIALGVPEDDAVVVGAPSPAKAADLLRKAGHKRKDIQGLLEGFVEKPKGKPTIAPLSDKREALVDITEDVFNALDSETEDEEM